jgi:polyisoprenoid-binding protein YceI
MKNYLIILLISLFSFTSILSQEKLTIDISESSIKWIGELTFSFGGHDGNINFKEGYFTKTDGKITGGEFIIDMNSITNNDIKSIKANNSLVNHLKNSDFFDVKKYPLAKLVVSKVTYFEDETIRIEADFTIKKITKPIKFNAFPDYQKKSLTTKFKIDRRAWNVNYTSKIKNSAISDGIGFEIFIKLQ